MIKIKALPSVIIPGYMEQGSTYRPLELALQELGYPTTTVPIKITDWIPTLGGRSIVPILKKIHLSVQEIKQQTQSDKINIIGHSAGGWIARIYMGEVPYTIHKDVSDNAGLWNHHSQVATLVTLGTPHFSYERWTQKNLNFVKDNYPGAYYSHVNYVCVAGKTIYGDKTWSRWISYNSYQLTCGRGETWGDGITPVEAAHLDGATNLTLEGVLHSPRSRGSWYGSPEYLLQWSGYLKLSDPIAKSHS